jgi:hypothetical protein
VLGEGAKLTNANGDNEMNKLYFNRRNLLKLTAGGITVSEVRDQVESTLIQSADSEDNFLILYPSNKEAYRGENVSFNFTVEQISTVPDDDSITSIGGAIGFRDAFLDEDNDKWRYTTWDEYSIVSSSTDDGIEWNQTSAKIGNWVWSSPENINQGDTRSFSVTIDVNDDATVGTHDISIFERETESGPTLLPDISPDKERFISLTVKKRRSPELELTAQGPSTIVSPGELATVSFELTNTSDDAVTGASVVLQPEGIGFDWKISDTTDPVAGDWISSNRNWVIDSNPDDIREMTITFEVPNDIDPDTYTVTAQADSLGDTETQDSATASITVEEQDGFNPRVDGFGFDNWHGFDLLSYSQVVSRTEDIIQNEVAQTAPATTDLPGFKLGFSLLMEQGMEGWANGHYLGMVTTSREYYYSDIPSLPNYNKNVDTPSDITVDKGNTLEEEPGLDPVGQDIDTAQSDQLFDSDFSLRYVAAAVDSDSIDNDAVLREIDKQLSNDTLPIICLTDTIRSGHAVLAYDIEGEIDEDSSVYVNIYDPDEKYLENTLAFTLVPTEGEYRFSGYGDNWDNLFVTSNIDPSYDIIKGGKQAFETVVAEGLQDYITFGVSGAGEETVVDVDDSISTAASVDVTVSAPDGRTLSAADIPPQELHQTFGYDQVFVDFNTPSPNSTSEYTIKVNGQQATTYELEVKGSQSSGEVIDQSTTDSIGAGETTAYSVDPQSPEDSDLEDNTNNRFADQPFNETQFNAVFGDDGTQTQNELSAAINQWFTSDSNTVNGVTLSQNDLSGIINYWFNKL